MSMMSLNKVFWIRLLGLVIFFRDFIIELYAEMSLKSSTVLQSF